MRLYLTFAGYVLALACALAATAFLLLEAVAAIWHNEWALWQQLVAIMGLLQLLVAMVVLILWIRIRLSKLRRKQEQRMRWARIMGAEHE